MKDFENLITPPTYVDIEELYEHRFIFLAGPVQGAEDWQIQAYQIIHGMDPTILVFSPRRLEEPQAKYSRKKSIQQVKWEQCYLRAAVEHSRPIMFWLAQEKYVVPGRIYAQTTRDEIAEHRTLLRLDQFRYLVVGIENGYSGASYQRSKLRQDAPSIPIHKSLKTTCQEAVWRAQNNWLKLERAWPTHYKW